MITQGEARYVNQNVGSVVGCALVGTIALMFGLMIWQAAVGTNPIESAFAQTLYSEKQF